MLTAGAISAPLGYWAAIPPATARPPRDAANSRARRVITFASMPIVAATRSGAWASSAARTRATSAGSGASRRATITCAIASASIPSVPGADQLRPRLDQLAERAAFEPRDERDPLAPRLLYFGLQASYGVVPCDLLPLAVGAAGHRIRDAIGVV